MINANGQGGQNVYAKRMQRLFLILSVGCSLLAAMCDGSRGYMCTDTNTYNYVLYKMYSSYICDAYAG